MKLLDEVRYLAIVAFDPSEARDESGKWTTGGNAQPGEPPTTVHLKDSLNIPREDMPQIPKERIQDYLSWLKDQGINSREETVQPKDLKPIQSTVDSRIAASLPGDVNIPGRPMIISKDSYILDGHHRWYKALTDGKSLNCLRLDVDMQRLLDVTRNYPKVEYHTVAQSMAKQGLQSQDERIKAVLAKSDADPAVQAAEKGYIMRGDSRADPGVLDAQGHYTPEADALNKRIADSFLNPAAAPPPGQKPEAIFILGKPGAGKTTLVTTMGGLPPVTMINSDDIKEKIPGYKPELAGSFHERSCDIARNYLTPEAIAAGHNVAFDMTDNQQRMMSTMKQLKAAGYKLHVILADVDDATSAERVYSRFKKTGRYVPVRVALSYGDRPAMAFEASKSIADKGERYATSGGPNKLIDSFGG
jgi:predicted ABC-type ATPase